MKKNLFLKSGIGLLILAGSSIGPAAATSYEGSMYSDLRSLQESSQWTTTAARGAEGPIRSADGQPAEFAGSSMGPGSATSTSYDESSMYSDLRSLQESQQGTMSTARGAEGPIRSVDVQPAASDIYASISKYHAAQQFNMSSSERGAQGPVRSEAEMTMERKQQEWKKMTGIFDGSTN